MKIWANIGAGSGTQIEVTIPNAHTLEEAARHLASVPWIKDDKYGYIYFTSHIYAIGKR